MKASECVGVQREYSSAVSLASYHCCALHWCFPSGQGTGGRVTGSQAVLASFATASCAHGEGHSIRESSALHLGSSVPFCSSYLASSDSELAKQEVK